MNQKFNIVLLSDLSYFEQISMQLNVYKFLFVKFDIFNNEFAKIVIFHKFSCN